MITAAIYKISSGEIIRIVSSPLSMVRDQCRDGEAWVVCSTSARDGSHYVDCGVISTRPAMPGSLNKTCIRADGTDYATVLGLPKPCTVTFCETPYEIDDGEFCFTVDLPGTYEITVEAFPFLPAKFTVKGEEI